MKSLCSELFGLLRQLVSCLCLGAQGHLCLLQYFLAAIFLVLFSTYLVFLYYAHSCFFSEPQLHYSHCSCTLCLMALLAFHHRFHSFKAGKRYSSWCKYMYSFPPWSTPGERTKTFQWLKVISVWHNSVQTDGFAHSFICLGPDSWWVGVPSLHGWCLYKYLRNMVDLFKLPRRYMKISLSSPVTSPIHLGWSFKSSIGLAACFFCSSRVHIVTVFNRSELSNQCRRVTSQRKRLECCESSICMGKVWHKSSQCSLAHTWPPPTTVWSQHSLRAEGFLLALHWVTQT